MQEQFNGKRIVFAIIGIGIIPHPYAKKIKIKNEPDTDLIPVIETYAKWIIDLNINLKI